MTYKLPEVVGRYGSMNLRENATHYAMEFRGKTQIEIIFWEKGEKGNSLESLLPQTAEGHSEGMNRKGLQPSSKPKEYQVAREKSPPFKSENAFGAGGNLTGD